MKNVTIVKGDLFSAPEGSIICHAVNTKGVWGAGIAKQFARKYPIAYEFYKGICQEYGKSLVGTCLVLQTETHKIACLFTSEGYGSNVDNEKQILYNTFNAIEDLLLQNEIMNKPIHMCKINSGLFGVDWYKTQRVLEQFNEPFTVYEF